MTKRQAQKANARQIGGDHYKQMSVEPWELIDANFPVEQQIGFYRGNAMKYLMRLGAKDDSAQDASKAAHYAEKLAEVLDQ